MDGRGGCCIARYDGGTYDTSKINRIMLRFRPIAPKPAVSGSVSSETSPEKSSDVFVKTTRTKRRYVKDNNNNSSSNNKRYCRKRKTVSVPEREKTEKNSIVTLSLLPEEPDRKESPSSSSSSDQFYDLSVAQKTPSVQVQQGLPSIWSKSDGTSYRSSDRTVVMMPQPVRPVGSCVVVGSVTEMFTEGEELGLGLGRTDEEKRKNLEVDTCPGFISDGLNTVRWTNEAYRKLVNNQDGSSEMVWLVMNKGLEPLMMMRDECTAFTCRVRLQYTCKERHSLIVPCDVWKMNGGGFAWRLDVKAALSLGR